MFEFWYDFVKPKYGKKAKLCYMDTFSFIVYIKALYLQRYCRRCWNKIWHLECNSIERPLPKGKNKNVIRLMKDELGGKIIKKLLD